MKKCAPYSASDLSEPVTFWRETVTADGAGGSSKAWAAVSGAPTWAMVRQASGRERALANRTEATAAIRIVVRYTDLLREADTVIIRGLRHAIIAIADWEYRQTWTLIDCERGVPV